MKYIPNSVSRFGHISALKLKASSPTLLVVTGVVGFGVTAVMAAKASRRAEPVIDQHHKSRIQINELALTTAQERKDTIALYRETGIDLMRVYGPTIVVGTASAASILYGHRLLRGRHVATLLAYSGLQEQFAEYRSRVVKTLGADAERDIYDGAHGQWVEDPDHKGEYKLAPVFSDDADLDSFLRPWIDVRNSNCSLDPTSTRLFLDGTQNWANMMLSTQGVVYLNQILKKLDLPECPEGQVSGWLRDGDGDRYIDFGIHTSNDPQTIAFREGKSREVRLNFNIDGNIFGQLMESKHGKPLRELI